MAPHGSEIPNEEPETEFSEACSEVVPEKTDVAVGDTFGNTEALVLMTGFPVGNDSDGNFACYAAANHEERLYTRGGWVALPEDYEIRMKSIRSKGCHPSGAEKQVFVSFNRFS